MITTTIKSVIPGNEEKGLRELKNQLLARCVFSLGTCPLTNCEVLQKEEGWNHFPKNASELNNEAH